MNVASKSSPPGPGRPRDLEKRAAILAAAARLFVARGYDAASMDAVAAEAGVSKLTVYNHFSDKENLFREAVVFVAEQYLPQAAFEMRPEGTIREQLLAIAQAFAALMHSPESEAVHRMMAADARLSGRLGPMFYEAGPKRMLDGFSAFLRRAVAQGQLDVPDGGRAAEHFFVLLKGEAMNRLLWGCPGYCGQTDTAAHVDSVVDLFLRAYAPR
ncbi:MAG: TetR/AcrR family transcriptional regulator [Pseudomonadota bacterium]|jgi:TetR/AcrR family transcriptional repressor of mexJK operon